MAGCNTKKYSRGGVTTSTGRGTGTGGGSSATPNVRGRTTSTGRGVTTSTSRGTGTGGGSSAPTATRSVRPQPPQRPAPKPVDETGYFNGRKASQIKSAMRNNPFPKIGNDLVKMKAGGCVRGDGICKRGRTKGRMV